MLLSVASMSIAASTRRRSLGVALLEASLGGVDRAAHLRQIDLVSKGSTRKHPEIVRTIADKVQEMALKKAEDFPQTIREKAAKAAGRGGT